MLLAFLGIVPVTAQNRQSIGKALVVYFSVYE
jgi:hypothetical protein